MTGKKVINAKEVQKTDSSKEKGQSTKSNSNFVKVSVVGNKITVNKNVNNFEAIALLELGKQSVIKSVLK